VIDKSIHNLLTMSSSPSSPERRAPKALTFGMLREALRGFAARAGDEAEGILRARTLRLDWLDLDDLGDELGLLTDRRWRRGGEGVEERGGCG
jgi:hypothetical protein